MNDEIIDDFRKILSCLSLSYKFYTEIAKETGFDEKYILALYQIADNAGFIEHGTSIRGSWITEKGQRYLLQKPDYNDARTQ